MSVVDQIHLKKEKWYNNDVFVTAANYQVLLIEPNIKEVDI
jgi:hypothetical protein